MRAFSLLCATVVSTSFSTVLASLGQDFAAYNAAHPGLNDINSDDNDFVKFKTPDYSNTLGSPTVAQSVSPVNTSVSIVPNAYLIQLAPGASLKRRGVRVGDEHFQFHKRAEPSIRYNTRLEFKNPDVFLGLSIQVQDSSNASTIQQIPGVVNVWPVRSIPRPAPIGSGVTGTMVSGNSSYHVTAQAGRGADVNHPHIMTGVDRLHALGIKGRGMKIAVMDTGVDYRHPALGGCFGKGCKISFGKAFVDDNYGDTGVAVASDDPLATCLGGGHGSHTSGIIGMEDPAGSTFGLVGVAPEATLGMYRIFGCSGGASDDIMMLAFQQAVEDKVDVLSISLGSVERWQRDDPFLNVTASLEAQGIAVIVAAGNDGGPALTSSPAVGEKVIAVGCLDNAKFPTVYTARDSNGNSLQYSGNPWPVSAPKTGLKVYDMTKLASNTTSPVGCTVSAWEAAFAGIPNPNNSIIAVPASSACSWAAKLNAAATYGLPYALVYAVDDGGIFVKDLNTMEPSIPNYGIMLSVDDGKKVIAGLASGGDYKLYFDSKVFESTEQPSAGLMSYFSSTGPTSDTLQIKPQLSAPGESILATWPLEGTGYAILSGTSMATPYAAGSYALIKSQHPTESVQQIRERLQSNAKSIVYTFDNTTRDSVTQQGAGMIDVFSAAFVPWTVSPSELNLGDLDALVPQTITVTNKSPSAKTYTITHEPAGESNLLPEQYLVVLDGTEVALDGQYKQYATVGFSTTTLTLAPGKSASFVATFTPPTDTPDRFLPVYSGFIKVSSGFESVTVTYLGQPYSRKKADVIDNTNVTGSVVPWMLNSHDFFTPLRDIGVFDFNLSGLGYPYLEWVTLQNSQLFYIDLLPYNTSVVPDFYGFDNSTNPYGVPNSSLPMIYPPLALNFTSAGVTSYGHVNQQLSNVRPSGYVWHVGPELYDDNIDVITEILPGDYRALLRVLRYGAKVNLASSYQTWLSPVIRVASSS
ncbi:subtilisin-like protease [Grosmannia clavigera kw1407]|uniref:Subtilisin-like protease n=1 Tax=Grosmannia clavigera (strain kw1407 / UAMH 11150) TaxID=655863 RepID=F0XE68_GROCL|nr:subtilisin-like protease [Grosmannia clavigera kw1407]EFX03716.1 subtilisin-like protease [Grosmannia clavigera kw1407]